MIHGKYFTSRDDLSAILALRKQVFCDEQGFSPELDRDKYDDMAFYALVYDQDEQPAATGRLYIDAESRFHIGRMCTRKDMRGKGLGDLAIRMLLDLALRMNAPYVVVESQTHAIGFYKKYGFTEAGDVFLDEENAPHQLLRADADAICLGCSCGGCAAGKDGANG